MMRIVDDLEARDLAVRRAVPGDRRLRAVELTDRGRGVFHAAEQSARQTSEALLAHLDPHERSALHTLLARFVAPGPGGRRSGG
jgi:DNA-binding MarR family transcriptional regulator